MSRTPTPTRREDTHSHSDSRPVGGGGGASNIINDNTNKNVISGVSVGVSGTKRKMYEQPEGLVAAFLWRLWIKTQTTFALSMLESWEIVLIFVLTGSVTLLVTDALLRFFPRAILFASQQARYYISGIE